MMELHLIGIIHSPHQQATGTPVQSVLAGGVAGFFWPTTDLKTRGAVRAGGTR